MGPQKPHIKRCWYAQDHEPIWGVFRHPKARRPVVMGRTLTGVARAAFWSPPGVAYGPGGA
jgi:hypothetical protein